MTRSTTLTLLCLLTLFRAADAQGLSIELHSGLQGINYHLNNGQTKLLPGGGIAFLYALPTAGPLTLLTGISGGIYRTQASFPDGTAFTSYQVDDEGSAFRYSTATQGYRESQRFFAAAIPLLLQYHSSGAGLQWYVDGGGELLLPSSLSTTMSARRLTLSGYYPDYNITVSNLPQHGFGTINNWSATATTKLKPAAALSAATGSTDSSVSSIPCACASALISRTSRASTNADPGSLK